MQVIHSIDELREALKSSKYAGNKIGFVPTMGALHDGHLSLIRQSSGENNVTVVSIFVNPLQFGPNEDLDKYPRTLESDKAKAESAGADIIFAPESSAITSKDILTFVDVEKMQDNLCGSKRPGHFRGVLTIVAKLFNIVTPDNAYFGKKDIQQFYIIKKMVKDLNFNITLTGCDIIRDENGLALSSRNIYLSKDEYNKSLIINKMIKKALSQVEAGEKIPQKIIKLVEDAFVQIEDLKIDYIKIVNESMMDVDVINSGDILAVAVYIGNTRLIDNHIIGDKICW